MRSMLEPLPFLLLCCALLRTGAPLRTQEIQPGGAITLELSASAAGSQDEELRQEVRVILASPGRYFATFHSSAFDVRVSTSDGESWIDADSGIGFDEMLTLDTDRASTRAILVGSRDGCGGSFTVSLGTAETRRGCAEWLAEEITFFEILLSKRSTSHSDKLAASLLDLELHAEHAGSSGIIERCQRLLLTIVGGDERPRWARVFEGERARMTGDREEALKKLRAVLDQEPPQSLAATALVLLGLGRLAEAEQSNQQAIDLLEEAADQAFEAGCAALEAFSRSRLAVVREAMTWVDEAREAHEHAVLLAESLEGPAIVQVLLEAASFSRDHAEFETARAALRKASEKPGSAPWQRLRLTTLLCDLDLHQARYADAEDRLKEIEESLQAASGDPGQLEVAEDFAHFLFRLGRVPECRRILRRILDHDGARRSAMHVEALITWSFLEEAEDDFAGAAESLSDALSECAEIGGPEYDRLAILINRGRVRRKASKLDLAQEDFQAALEAAIQRGLSSIEAAALDGMARVHLARGELAPARELIHRAADGYRRAGEIDFLLDCLIDQARIHLALREEQPARAVLAEAVSRMSSMDVLGTRGSASIRSRFFGFGEVAQDLTALACSSRTDPTERSAAVQRGFLACAEWKGRALLAEIAVREEADRSLYDEDQLSKIRDCLGPERALVEFSSGERELYAYVLDSRSLEMIALGNRRAVEREVFAFIEEIFVFPRIRDPRSVADAGHRLFQTLMQPVLARLEPRVRGLVIVPTEWLSGLPFESLVVTPPPSGSHPTSFSDVRFLLDELEVSYCPSSPILARLVDRPSRSGTGRALILADARFPSEERSGVLETRSDVPQLRRLVRSRSEAIEIADRLIPPDEQGGKDARDRLWACSAPGRRDGSLETPGFDLYLGSQATVDRLLDADLSGYRILHLATHGWSDASDPARTGLFLSPGASGQVLIDLPSIHGIELDADLVVLSACETARGRVLKGEGVQSLALAFLERGARGVVATLWKVEDSAAAEIMRGFYGEFCAGPRIPPATALRRARLGMRNSSQERGVTPLDSDQGVVVSSGHPCFWAQFVCIGGIR